MLATMQGTSGSQFACKHCNIGSLHACIIHLATLDSLIPKTYNIFPALHAAVLHNAILSVQHCYAGNRAEGQGYESSCIYIYYVVMSEQFYF